MRCSHIAIGHWIPARIVAVTVAGVEHIVCPLNFFSRFRRPAFSSISLLSSLVLWFCFPNVFLFSLSLSPFANVFKYLSRIHTTIQNHWCLQSQFFTSNAGYEASSQRESEKERDSVHRTGITQTHSHTTCIIECYLYTYIRIFVLICIVFHFSSDFCCSPFCWTSQKILGESVSASAEKKRFLGIKRT